MKHGKNFTLGEYVIIKKPDLMTIGDNVRISDFCRISSACDIGSDCEIAPGTYIAGGDGKYTFKMGECSSLAAGVKVWLSSNDYVNELVTHSVPEGNSGQRHAGKIHRRRNQFGHYAEQRHSGRRQHRRSQFCAVQLQIRALDRLCRTPDTPHQKTQQRKCFKYTAQNRIC